ncbi:MAG: hypothetical protein HYU29_08060 [Chloroflexi bacterium]|nr:hypothetical protein [Chloroflexota bacterium]
MSKGKLIGTRVVLGIWIVLNLLFGLGFLLIPQTMYESFVSGAKEPLTDVIRALFAIAGTASITWAVAAGIAFRSPIENRGLLQALIVAMGFYGLLGLYFDGVVLKAGASALIIDALYIVLGVVLLFLYPRAEKAAA